METGILTIIVMLSIVGSLICAGVLVVIQFVAEGARLRTEALARKARRLRYKDSNAECQPPAIAATYYHTFLSHVWSTGQDQVSSKLGDAFVRLSSAWLSAALICMKPAADDLVRTRSGGVRCASSSRGFAR